MLRRAKILVVSGMLFGALTACVADPALMAEQQAEDAAKTEAAAKAEAERLAAEAKLNAPMADNTAIYAATMDGQFQVPSVPVSKVPAQLQRQIVDYATDDAPGTVIIDPANKTLHLITGPNRAVRYGIAVGKAGFEWSGEALITGRKTWPTWTPPKEMISRKPELVKWEDGQPGGPTNPLGARALYLTTNGVDYGYRIHGTPEWNSIGRNASSGCIRMINQDVMDLYNRVPDGARVIVLNRDGSRPSALQLPPPVATPAKKPAAKKAAPKPAAVAEPAVAVTPLATPVVTPVPAVTPAPLVSPVPAVTPVVTPAPALDSPVSNTPAAGFPPLGVSLPAVPPALVAPAPVPLVQPAPATTTQP